LGVRKKGGNEKSVQEHLNTNRSVREGEEGVKRDRAVFSFLANNCVGRGGAEAALGSQQKRKKNHERHRVFWDVTKHEKKPRASQRKIFPQLIQKFRQGKRGETWGAEGATWVKKSWKRGRKKEEELRNLIVQQKKRGRREKKGVAGGPWPSLEGDQKEEKPRVSMAPQKRKKGTGPNSGPKRALTLGWGKGGTSEGKTVKKKGK